MSDIGLSYDATITPSPVQARFELSFSGQTLKATIKDINNFVILLKPSGNVSEMIISSIATPLAQTMGAVLPSMGKHLIEGHSIGIMNVAPVSQSIDGENIAITPENLSASTWNDMLMVQGNINVT